MKIYTTGQVSKLCKVATSTVNKWVDVANRDALYSVMESE